ncbi:MAG: hypothetical protein AAGI72_18445 [Pseudomonadota bacterium]
MAILEGDPAESYDTDSVFRALTDGKYPPSIAIRYIAPDEIQAAVNLKNIPQRALREFVV